MVDDEEVGFIEGVSDLIKRRDGREWYSLIRAPDDAWMSGAYSPTL